MSPRVAPFLAVFCCIPGLLHAAPPKPRTDERPLPPPAAVQVFDNGAHIDANNISMVVTNTGSFAFDQITGSGGFEFPRGSGKSAIFAGGLWLGARVNGQTRVAIAEYSDEYLPGQIVSGIPDDPNRPEYKVYKLNRTYGSAAERDAALADYQAGAVPHGAPPVALLPDGTLGILGDQMLWSVYNDATPYAHTNRAGSTAPLGVEVQQTTFAFNRPGPLANTVFISFKIINKSPNTLGDMFYGFWFDPDLGGATDDLVGCNRPRSIGYCYNADNLDEVYGSPPPAVGISLIQGPGVGFGTRLGMTGFGSYINGTDPNTAAGAYSALEGFTIQGFPPVDPTTGLPTTFMFSGDPITNTGWIDATPADKRMLLSSGPAGLAPGYEQELMIAVGVGVGDNRLRSLQQYLCDEDAVRQFALAGFTGPDPEMTQCFPPPAPCDRPADYWTRQCDPGAELSELQIQGIAQWVDEHSGLYQWGQDQRASLCAELAAGNPSDVRAAARREFASLMATVAASEQGILTPAGVGFGIDLTRPVSCPSVPATNLDEAVRMAQIAADGSYLDLTPSNPVPIEGFNWGGSGFGGGVGRSVDLFGGPIEDPNDFPVVEIRFDHAHPQYAYRYLRRELPGGGTPSVGRGYVYGGFHSVPFTCWDVTHNVQLDVMFLEKVVTADDGTILGPEFQLATLDSTWSPDDSFDGNREILWVIARPYTGSPRQEIVDYGNPLDGSLPSTYVLWSRRLSPASVFDDGDRFRFAFSIINSGVDAALMLLETQPQSDPAVLQAYADIATCLHTLNENDGKGPGCVGPPVAPVANAGNDVTVECAGAEGTPVQLDGSHSTGSNLSYHWFAPGVTFNDPGSAHPTGVFPVGTTLVELTVITGTYYSIDAVNVTIVDTTPPGLTVALTPDLLWPPNHKLVAIHAEVTAVDCDASPDIRLISLDSTEEDSGTGPEDVPGDAEGVEAGTADFEFQLRAERADEGPGRTYTVCYEARDDAGNATVKCATVGVPHDQRGRATLVGGAGARSVVIFGDRRMAARSVDGTSLTVSSASFERVRAAGNAPSYGDVDRDGFEDALIGLAGEWPGPGGSGSPSLFVRWQAAGQGYLAEATPSAVTGIASLELPTRFEAGIAGNPVRETAVIQYALPRAGRVRIGIFDIAGHRVAGLVDGVMPAGRHEARFTPGGSQLYFYRVEWEGKTTSGKLVVVR